MLVFESAKLGVVTVKNRIIRSATFEGMCDDSGCPTVAYTDLYCNLAKENVGAIITGFTYISADGKAMQPGQAGMDGTDKVGPFQVTTEAVHRYGSKIFMQLAHTGRQTSQEAVEGAVVGVSHKKSPYFKVQPKKLSTSQAERVITRFADSAFFAQQAGFDGIQLHAAHGYLLHQFILPAVNDRTDRYGIDSQTGIGTSFFEAVIDEVRRRCGPNFPVLVKISAADDNRQPFGREQLSRLIGFLDRKQVAGIEISYGTMDQALNIFRGDIPIEQILKFNPFYRVKSRLLRYCWKVFVLPILRRRVKPFTSCYNLDSAQFAKRYTDIPIISVGGFRQGREIHLAVEKGRADFVALSRPLLCEPGFVTELKNDPDYVSRCCNCNICAVMCDSKYPTRCYGKGRNI
ncbi:MAG: NADH:flavin oxidoreductase [Proteobacteria bacterium]|nr:NADH:flavin oxidoreductase [Pseudomonadota bacterium]MBU1689070.1 NADH:flavin oxidoreductase [Pseudomonadota bacterium]